MAELPDLHKIAAAQPLRMLTMQEAQLRELAERVKLQDELLEATVNALATICEQLPGDAPEGAAKLRNLMFDRKKLDRSGAAVLNTADMRRLAPHRREVVHLDPRIRSFCNKRALRWAE